MQPFHQHVENRPLIRRNSDRVFLFPIPYSYSLPLFCTRLFLFSVHCVFNHIGPQIPPFWGAIQMTLKGIFVFYFTRKCPFHQRMCTFSLQSVLSNSSFWRTRVPAR